MITQKDSPSATISSHFPFYFQFAISTYPESWLGFTSKVEIGKEIEYGITSYIRKNWCWWSHYGLAWGHAEDDSKRFKKTLPRRKGSWSG